MNPITILAPRLLYKSNIPTFIFSYNKACEEIYAHDDNYIIFDLSNVERVDVEGLNYIMVFPFKLKLLNENVLIKLPTRENVLAYFEYTELLDVLFKNFKIIDYARKEDLLFGRRRIYTKTNITKARVSLYDENSYFALIDDINRLYNLIDFKQYADYMCKCFIELSKNIFDHSGQKFGGFAFHLFRNKYSQQIELTLCITDAGIGIRESFVNNAWNKQRTFDDAYFIEQAIQKGVSSTNIKGRGLGLYDVVNFASDVHIRSGYGTTKIKHGNIVENKNQDILYYGTSVNVNVKL